MNFINEYDVSTFCPKQVEVIQGISEIHFESPNIKFLYSCILMVGEKGKMAMMGRRMSVAFEFPAEMMNMICVSFFMIGILADKF